MTDAARKAASAGTSILFAVDVPQSDMLQTELLWEVTEAFANRSKPSVRSNKPLYVVFLQPQHLADCWPDICNGQLSPCNECSEKHVDDAAGMDCPVMVDVYHLPLFDQVMTVELFFAREHYADRVTSVRVTRAGCMCLKDNGNGSAQSVVDEGRKRRKRTGTDQRATDVYSEAFKFLHRSELDACELVGRRWFQHIRTVAGVLPLHHIPSAVISHSPETLRCELLEPQRRRKTRTFDLTGGQPDDLNGLRNSNIGTMRIDEYSGVIIAVLSDWFKVEVNRTTVRNLLLPVPLSASYERSDLPLSNVLNGAQPEILQLSFNSAHRDFRHIVKALSEAVPISNARLIVVRWAIRENRHLLDFALRSRLCPFFSDVYGLFQRQRDIGALRHPLYVEYTGSDPVLLDLTGVPLDKESPQRSLLFPSANSESGIYSGFEDRTFDVYRVANRSNDAVLLHVSKKPSAHTNDEGTFKRYVAFVPSSL